MFTLVQLKKSILLNQDILFSAAFSKVSKGGGGGGAKQVFAEIKGVEAPSMCVGTWPTRGGGGGGVRHASPGKL